MLRYDTKNVLLRYDTKNVVLRYDTKNVVLRDDTKNVLLRYDTKNVVLRYNKKNVLNMRMLCNGDQPSGSTNDSLLHVALTKRTSSYRKVKRLINTGFVTNTSSSAGHKSRAWPLH